MALSPNYLNYQDWAQKTNNGKIPIATLGLEVDRATTLMNDLPLVQATGKFDDEGKFAQPWVYGENSDVAGIDSPFLAHKTGSYDRFDLMGMRKSGVEIDREEMKALSAAEQIAYRTSEASTMMKHLALDAERDLIYGSPDIAALKYAQPNDPRNCNGLVSRFNKITDPDGIASNGKLYPYITLDAGGTNSSKKLTSAYLLIPSAEGVCRLMSNGTQYTGSISYEAGTWYPYEDIDKITGLKGIKEKANDKLQLAYGISVRNRRSCIRIANIDLEHMDKFIAAFRDAMDVIDESTATGNYHLYMNPRATSAYQAYLDSQVQATKYGDARPTITEDGEMRIGKWKIRKTHQLLLNESLVV